MEQLEETVMMCSDNAVLQPALCLGIHVCLQPVFM